jgi:hypothetical protein
MENTPRKKCVKQKNEKIENRNRTSTVPFFNEISGPLISNCTSLHILCSKSFVSSHFSLLSQYESTRLCCITTCFLCYACGCKSYKNAVPFSNANVNAALLLSRLLCVIITIPQQITQLQGKFEYKFDFAFEIQTKTCIQSSMLPLLFLLYFLYAIFNRLEVTIIFHFFSNLT